jgi:heavy metal sensor kinase
VSSLRARILLWYGALIALCLIAYSITIGISFTRHVEAEWNDRAHEDIELAARAMLLDETGQPHWPSGFLRSEAMEEEGGGHWIEIWTDNGKQRLLAAGTRNPGLTAPPRDGETAHSVVLPTGSFRVLSESVAVGPFTTFLVRASISEGAGRRQIHSLWRQLALLSLTVLALGGVGAYLLVQRFLGPLARMANHARRISVQHLSDRLSLEDAGTEVNQLRDALNETLSRLEGSFEQLRTFTADASHELRTPLTALRSVGEVSLQHARSAEEYREVIGMMLEEADRLSRLVDDLLTLARADASGARPMKDRVDLSAIGREVGEQLAVLAEQRHQSLQIETNGAVMVRGNKIALRQAIMNLVDNAINYSPEGSRVRLLVGIRDNGAFVEVHDSGPGIAAPHRDRVFERFYRVDSGRPREKGGTGLGLAIVKSTAEDHGGRVELDTEIDRGSTFRIVLPSAE